jgi:hypothetical protein
MDNIKTYLGEKCEAIKLMELSQDYDSPASLLAVYMYISINSAFTDHAPQVLELCDAV